jgi:hypothetical protein
VDNLFIAYKYLNLGNGLLVVFDNKLTVSPNISMTIKKTDNNCCLVLDENYLIPLSDDIIDHLTKTKKIYIAYSDIFDNRMEPLGTIELSDISMGKLLAYIEIEQNV